VHFRYWPRPLGTGLVLFGVTVVGIALWMRRSHTPGASS
jgi:hypothetical protein